LRRNFDQGSKNGGKRDKTKSEKNDKRGMGGGGSLTWGMFKSGHLIFKYWESLNRGIFKMADIQKREASKTRNFQNWES